jgi:hypothetical protein
LSRRLHRQLGADSFAFTAFPANYWLLSLRLTSHHP